MPFAARIAEVLGRAWDLFLISLFGPASKRTNQMNTQPIETGPSGPFVIRDPVHGYLTVAVHERIVVDHRVTQRLRRITQTGLAEYVFPEARTSRFVHSLGAMHLASRFVIAALENADEQVAEAFFDDMDSRVSTYLAKREDLDALLRQDGTLSALASTRVSFRHPKLRSERTRRLMAVVEGGLRLAALFHDLGHLPMSHDIEYALQDYAAQKSSVGSPPDKPLLAIAGTEAPHEEVGHRLSDLVFESLVSNTSPASKACFEMARAILNVRNPRYDQRRRPEATFLQWLHSLIDGEIDADRADYLLRDGQALGLDFAHYDVDRLVSNLILIHEPELGYVTAVKEHGLPALESYCLSRSRSNQIFIRHHKVAQTAAALRHASRHLLDGEIGQPFLRVLGKLGSDDFRHGGTELLDEFSLFDDTWWVQSLRKLQQGTTDSLLRACLDLVLDRGRTLRSLWKRKGDLRQGEFKAINAKVDMLFAAQTGQLEFANKRKQLLERGVLINAFKFRPYLRRQPNGDSLMLIKSRGATYPASAMSSLIRNMYDAWEGDIHLYAFVERTSSLTTDEVVGMTVDS